MSWLPPNPQVILSRERQVTISEVIFPDLLWKSTNKKYWSIFPKIYSSTQGAFVHVLQYLWHRLTTELAGLAQQFDENRSQKDEEYTIALCTEQEVQRWKRRTIVPGGFSGSRVCRRKCWRHSISWPAIRWIGRLPSLFKGCLMCRIQERHIVHHSLCRSTQVFLFVVVELYAICRSILVSLNIPSESTCRTWQNANETLNSLSLPDHAII